MPPRPRPAGSDPKPETAPFLGVLALDTAFPRIPGDAGNPASYPFAVRIRTVAGGEVPLVVRRGGPAPPLADAFVAAAVALAADGAVGLVTTCGFLVHVQDRLAAAVPVPVIASALLLAPLMVRACGGRPVGVLAADAGALDAAALAAAGIDPAEAVVEGLEDEPAFRNLILADKAHQGRHIDTAALEAAVVRRGRAMVERRRDLGAIVLECTNLPPYAAALHHATGRPVVSILDAAAALWAAASTALPHSAGTVGPG
ncbi:MAG: aspartate/glutamate racemase family protein [Rhodospirillaceae bacterium]|nr:aspartate/glutamate racemase family protein [Rhodospirillaceae bacterium]